MAGVRSVGRLEQAEVVVDEQVTVDEDEEEEELEDERRR